MNSRILTFIIGVLTGAIIMTLVFMFVPVDGRRQVPPGGFGGQPPEMQNDGNMGQPPAMPNGEMPPQAQ